LIPTQPIRTPWSRSSSTTSSIGPEHGSERDHDRLGVVAAVAPQQTTGGTAELLLERGGDLSDQVERH